MSIPWTNFFDMTYRFKSIPTKYNGVQYRSRLEAKWAAFFDIIKWKFTYEPYDLNKWSPDFKLITGAGQSLLVEVKPQELINISLRLKVGEASNYSDGRLIVNESPFKYPYPNCIGLTSLFGKSQNHKEEDDFEFCTSVIMNLFNEGLGIYNLCNENEEVHSNFDTATEFCLPMWTEAGNQVMFLKPNQK